MIQGVNSNLELGVRVRVRINTSTERRGGSLVWPIYDSAASAERPV